MKCVHIVNENNMQNTIQNIAYMDIFGTINKQVAAVKVWKKILKIWEIKLEVSKLSPSGQQVHQAVSQSASYAHASSAQTVDVVSPSPDDSSISNVYDFG